MVVKDAVRWNRACKNNSDAFEYIKRYRNKETTFLEDKEFINKFTNLFHSTIDKIYKKYKVPDCCDREDLLQICNITLYSCVKNFNIDNKEAQFVAYLRRALKNNIITYLRLITKNWKDVMLNTEFIESLHNL